ncbi:uncharacterized protein LOC143148995 isoform X1 [Ptiloglossa arizonensis]|uniref:uncharacterized protein LOC143148995 isoform X1 n=1 Tax=Ptiloglossa arizonensis TaxID=3350558 RepID=UPI003F9FD579
MTENLADSSQQRSVRVHRVADDEFHGNNENGYGGTTKPSGNLKQVKFLTELPDLNELMQRETELFKVLKTILKELSRDIGTKSVDTTVNEMTDTTVSPMFIKLAWRNPNGLRNLVNLPGELNIHYPDGQDSEKQPKSGLEETLKSFLSSRFESMNEAELKTVRNIEQYLDNVLLEAQNHIICIRNLFEKLCREHHVKSSPPAAIDNPGNSKSTNQTKNMVDNLK